MHPKLEAEKQDRDMLTALAKEDPESWAAEAVQARDIARSELQMHKKGSPYLTRALRGLQLAEQLERTILKRYQDKPATNGKKPQTPPEPTGEDTTFAETLRQEHQTEPTTHDQGPPATTNGVLVAAHDAGTEGSRVTAPA